MRRSLVWGGLLLLLLLTLLPMAVWASEGVSTESALFQTASDQPATVQTGVVNANRLNVRAAPRLFSRAIGQLTRNTTVQILGREGNWYQIVYAPATDGVGWVSATYILLTPAATQPAGALTPTGTLTTTTPISSTLVPAPTNFAYDGQRFTWSWQRSPALANRDWYFDVQLFCNNSTSPFQVFVVEPSAANEQGSNWRFTLTQPVRPDCGAYGVVQIAMRVNGRFNGWSSLKSNSVTITAGSTDISTPNRGNTPDPEPTGEPQPEPTSEPQPEPTAEPQPEPTSELQPEPTSEPEPEPTGEAVR